MFEPHEGTLQLKNEFQKAYNWLEKRGPAELKTKSRTRFIAKANITRRGPHTGEKVIRFMQDGKEYGRAYECCWGHYYNCNRTRIGMYCTALDNVVGWSQELYCKAFIFAAKAHESINQKFPGTNLPYIVHINLVSMEIMAALSFEDDLDGDLAIQCALLHDVMEDVGIKYDTLKNKFESKVADGVNALSKNKAIKSKREQMIDSLERIKKQPKEVRMVKLADRISNLGPPPSDWDQEKISKYKEEAKLIYDNLKDANKFLADRLKHKIDNYNWEKPTR